MAKRENHIKKDFDSFLKEHEEIRVRYHNGKIVFISLPEDADVFMMHIAKGEVIALDYCYKGNRITF